eukprot:SAG31_NODE_10766_length_1100_cov_1.674326_1_plen_204_part_00
MRLLCRTNMPDGPIDFLTTAKSSMSGDAEQRPKKVVFNASQHLLEGENLFAVSVHQKTGLQHSQHPQPFMSAQHDAERNEWPLVVVTSTDLIFDLRLRGNKLQPCLSQEILDECSRRRFVYQPEPEPEPEPLLALSGVQYMTVEDPFNSDNLILAVAGSCVCVFCLLYSAYQVSTFATSFSCGWCLILQCTGQPMRKATRAKI